MRSWTNLQPTLKRLLTDVAQTALTGTFYQLIHVAFQCFFTCVTVGSIVGALAQRSRFSAVMIFVLAWVIFAYVPMAHMVYAGGYLTSLGDWDFAGGTVVHIDPVSFWKKHSNLITTNGIYWSRYPVRQLIRLQRRLRQRALPTKSPAWPSSIPSWPPPEASFPRCLLSRFCAINHHCWVRIRTILPGCWVWLP